MYPRLLHIYGPLWVQSYGVMIVLGFLLFLFLAYNDSRRARLIDSDTFFNVIFVGLVSAVVGGRLLFMITEWSSFSNPWLEMFCVWKGGFVVLGSIIGVITAVPIYLKMHSVKVLRFLDIVALYGPLMQSVARIGCLLAGCCYGAQVHGFIFSIIFNDPVGLAPTGVALHPTQIYMSLLSLSIFVILFTLKRSLQKPGQTIFLYLVLESIARIGVDFWRGDRGDVINISCLPFDFSLSLMQIWSLGFLAISILVFTFVSARKRDF
ncbi:MAG: prolipoprotein diacylglyceryl transferase family protein [Candidatus Babeliales bacterium]|jgi:phosphatidylglycerol:prolipoprotein diacylglycerol transferase